MRLKDCFKIFVQVHLSVTNLSTIYLSEEITYRHQTQQPATHQYLLWLSFPSSHYFCWEYRKSLWALLLNLKIKKNFNQLPINTKILSISLLLFFPNSMITYTNSSKNLPAAPLLNTDKYDVVVPITISAKAEKVNKAGTTVYLA